MLVRAFILSAVLAATVAASAAPADPGPGWSHSTAAGSIRVSEDRRRILVCDNKADNLYVEAEYATPILGIHTVADANGAEWGCSEEGTFLSHIDVIKLCTGIRGVTRRCEQPVWITNR
ncbi:hypothetical protein ABZU75_19285 [Streptosporangium sp. NPDC005286]|uniref:hypothetical protein n=1 Tax=Streptosporangium sp. NPDC005286 TaxID=3154463 RepID=UPI0033A0BE0B